MSRRRRVLEPGADGKAEVVVLTDPMPRALSIVSWGANDRPAESWMSSTGSLREPPSVSSVQRAAEGMTGFVEYIDETLSAWEAVIIAALGSPVSAQERSSRVAAATAQASARVAALVRAVGRERVAVVTASYTPQRAKEPDFPTVDSEMERAAFVAAAAQARAYIRDSVLSVVSASGGGSTEEIMAIFERVGSEFAAWTAGMRGGRPGVVGVASQRAGARHSKKDRERLTEIRRLLQELDPTEESESGGEPAEESSMTIEQLKQLAESDPVGFMTVISVASKAAAEKVPSEAKKFGWGETGVDQYGPDAILGGLRRMLDGGQFASVIADAIAGVDLDRSASGSSPQVSAAMKAAIGRVIEHELRTAPTGALAAAVREIVAPSVAEAIKSTVKVVLEGSSVPQGSPAAMLDYGSDADDFADPTVPVYPTLNRGPRA